MSLTPALKEKYREEILRRHTAIDSFSNYRGFVREDYQEWGYVTPVNDLLRRCYERKVKRAMVFLPPQSGKTAAVSEDFPAYCIGKDPSINLIGCAYNSDRASDYGESVRDQVKSPEFKKLFPNVTLAEDSQAKDRWSVQHNGRKKGGYFAAGVGTALTGRKGDIMIIDDPFKDREDADSELTRERVWRWYHAVFRTRLAPNGVIIVICTRWHDDDLAGRLLAAQDDWEVLSIPAEAGDNDILGRKKGEFLSECRGGARYSREDYADLKKNMPPYEWASLFQQNPTPDEGIYFQKDWFQTYENIPWGVTTYVTADLSYTDKNTSDYAVVCAWDIDSDGNWYLKDMWRNKATPDVTASIFVDFCRDFKPVEAILEKVDDNFGGPLIRKLLEERGVNAYITTVSAAGHKEQKATSYRAQLSRGKVFIPQKFWTEDFISEHLRFPNGKHDDMVDNGSLLGRHMDIIRGGTVKTSKTRNNPNSGDNIIKSLRDMQPKAKVRLA